MARWSLNQARMPRPLGGNIAVADERSQTAAIATPQGRQASKVLPIAGFDECCLHEPTSSRIRR
jgi:hypothetical protein